MMRLSWWTLLLAVAVTPATVLAGEAAGDPDAGRTKFYTCAGCHSSEGYSNAYPAYPVPRLGGQHAAYIVSSLKSYREKERKHGSMQGNASALSDQDMIDIGAYVTRFRSISVDNAVKGNPASGKTKAAACASCHGEDGNSKDTSFPRLAGQYEGFIVKALQDYKSGARNNAMMSGFAGSLSESDIHDIAAYYASQSRGLTIVKD